MSGVEVTGAFDIGFSLDDVRNTVRGELLRSKRDVKRIQRPLIAVSDPGAGPGLPTVCRVGDPGPASGKVWDIRNFCAVGADDHTTGAFPGGLYVGGVSGLSTGDYGIASIRDTIPSVPFSETYSNGEVLVNHGESVFVVLWGVTLNLIYTVTLLVDEYNSEDKLAQVM